MNLAARTRAWRVGARRLTRQRAFQLGLADMGAMAVGVAAWGLVTGVAMVKSGMALWLAVAVSLCVYAGSAQLVVVPLMASGSTLWVIWLTACCVNLRFVIFSALWRQYFAALPRTRRMAIGYFSGDTSFVIFQKRFPEPVPQPGQQAYFWGAASLNWVTWQVSSIGGMLLAHAVPERWGLGFAGVLALAGVMFSMLGDRVSRVAAGVAAAAAVAAWALPLRLNLLVGIAAAMAVGLVLDAALPARSRVVRRTGAKGPR